MRQGQLRAVLGCLHRLASPDGGGPDDAQLLERWRHQRDPLAFEVLVWRHGAMVWNVCRRILGREADVEDAFQATFLIFLRKVDTIGQGRFLGSWLYKVAYRTAVAARAALARHTVHEELDADYPGPAATEEDAWDEFGPVLDEEVNRLPEKYRLPLVLCYLEGKTTDEAAQDLGCPRGTVGTRLAWARERLRSRLIRRGLALPAAGLATLLAAKTGAASVPAPLVGISVKAATFRATAEAVAAGVISVRAAALSRDVLQAMFVTKLKTVALVLTIVTILGSGAGLLTHQAVAGKTEQTRTAEGKQPAEEGVAANRDRPERADEANRDVAEEDNTPPARDKVRKSDPLQVSGTVVQVDQDGKSLGLVVPSKIEGGASKREIKITDKTRVVFSNVGPNGARLTEGYHADVCLEKGNKDVAASVHLSEAQKTKNAPHLAGLVVAVATDCQSITLEKRGKGKEPAENIAIKFTNNTRVFFSNVARDGARMTVGYEARVWLDEDSQDSAESVTFFGTAEGKSAQGKDQKVDRSGRIVGLSANGKVLILDMPPTKGAEPTRTEIKLTDATGESYQGVATDGAKPVEGDQVQVWLAEGSQHTAAQVRFCRNNPRKSVDARILAVAADGSRLTVGIPHKVKGGESTKLEIIITGKTKLVFFNVGPGGAKLTEGYHVRGWLVEGSEETADELMLSGSEKTDDKKPVDRNPDNQEPNDKR